MLAALAKTTLWFLAWSALMLGLINLLPNNQMIPTVGLMVGIVGWVMKLYQRLSETRPFDEASEWTRRMPIWIRRTLVILSIGLFWAAIVWKPNTYWLFTASLTCLAMGL